MNDGWGRADRWALFVLLFFWIHSVSYIFSIVSVFFLNLLSLIHRWEFLYFLLFIFCFGQSFTKSIVISCLCVPRLLFAQGRCCGFDVLRVLTGSATCPTAQFDRTRYSRRRQGEAAGYRCFLGFGPVRGKCRGHPVGEWGRPLLQWRGRAALHLFGGSWHQLPS